MLQCVATMVLTAWLGAPEGRLPTSLDLTRVRALPVQSDGRWPPLDTVARDTVEKVTGDAFHDGRDPVVMLLAWTVDAATWQRQPLIRIGNAELRGELGLSPTQTVYSYAELVAHERLLSLIDALGEQDEGHKPNPLESKVSDIHEKLIILQRVFGGQLLRFIPDAESVGGTWRTIPAGSSGTAEIEPVRLAWAGLAQAFVADDAPAFATATDQLSAALAALPSAYRADPRLIATELRYNRLDPFRKAWIIMACGAVLAIIAMIFRQRWLDVLAVLTMLAGFGFLTYGLWMRWQIAGQIPASNMFESLLFLSWGTGPAAILSMLVLRTRIVPLMVSLTGALALFLATTLPLDHYIRPIPPVLLDTVWMSIHVPIIMFSYYALAIAMFVAHAQLGVMALAPHRRSWASAIDMFHYWCVQVGSILLLAGIITGSMWGASSWGRYWGWDPKEVWSLIAFVGYLTILHVRIDRERAGWWIYAVGALVAGCVFVLVVRRLAPLSVTSGLGLAGTAAAVAFFVLARSRLATALKSVLCFWLIVMTYVGVNYVLGIGLHSYGFGTGAVAHYMLLTGGIDLALASLLFVIALVRRPTQAAAPVELTVSAAT